MQEGFVAVDGEWFLDEMADETSAYNLLESEI
jgi:hypothetical protein